MPDDRLVIDDPQRVCSECGDAVHVNRAGHVQQNGYAHPGRHFAVRVQRAAQGVLVSGVDGAA